MQYDTLYFVCFFALVSLLFVALPWRGLVLLAASIVFYSVAGLRDSLLATALILINYAFQFAILKERRWLWLALAINFSCLAYFKYRAFLASAAGFDVFTHGIVIPLGISFYIFQLSAFLIDLSRGRAEPFISLPRFALFKLYYGQLVAGPIVRWRQFGPQVHRLFEGRWRRHRLVSLGLGLCLLGLTKKVVLADSFAPFVDTIFREGPANAAAAWFGVWLFGFQIYFDFSGYSDIALGIAYLFGIRLPFNFRQPYLARSPQDFWRRWHITLSQWIRDYLYIPLGGRDGGALRQATVLVVVMALAGLWHGANWTFLVWGVGWAMAVVVWRYSSGVFALLPPLEWILTIFIAMLLWTFFRAGSLGEAFTYLGAMFGGAPAGTAHMPADGFDGALVLLGCASLLALHRIEAELFTRRAVWLFRRCDGAFLRVMLATISIWLVVLPKVHHAPFIYFRF